MALTEPDQRTNRTLKPEDIILTSINYFKMWEQIWVQTSCPTIALTEPHQTEDSCSQATRHSTHKQRGSKHEHKTFSNCLCPLTLNRLTRKLIFTNEKTPCANQIEDRPNSAIVTWKWSWLLHKYNWRALWQLIIQGKKVHTHPANKKQELSHCLPSVTLLSLHKCDPHAH